MKKKKRPLTLLEIMIVIAIITLITGVIGFNMRGTLDRGKDFRTNQARAQLEDMLLLCIADGHTPEEVVADPEKYLNELGLAKDAKKLLQDGWGQKFAITYVEYDEKFCVQSKRQEDFLQKKERR